MARPNGLQLMTGTSIACHILGSLTASAKHMLCTAVHFCLQLMQHCMLLFGAVQTILLRLVKGPAVELDSRAVEGLVDLKACLQAHLLRQSGASRGY